MCEHEKNLNKVEKSLKMIRETKNDSVFKRTWIAKKEGLEKQNYEIIKKLVSLKEPQMNNKSLNLSKICFRRYYSGFT